MVTVSKVPSMGTQHRLKVLVDVNEYKAGEVKDVIIQKMIGRIYKPGRTPDGKGFLDTVGVPDERYAVMGLFVPIKGIMDEFYKTMTLDEMNATFEEIMISTANVPEPEVR